MNSIERYNFWLTNDYFDGDTKAELELIKDNEKEIEERFYRDLEFGTGGLRGIIGAGTNMINQYTIRKASKGLAEFVVGIGEEAKNRGVVISYDSRNKSEEFALESALVFATSGIKTYLFDELRPVPMLSFAVRHLNTSAGVMVTASHNPKEYNGYKVYGEDGGQLPLESSKIVLEKINNIEDITCINPISKEEAIKKGLLKIVGKEIDDEFMKCLKTLLINPEVILKVADKMKIIYTPLHGTGNKPVRRILSEIGVKNVQIVEQQELPDPNFSTVKSPNPEEKEAFNIAISMAKEHGDIDLIIGTDPDCDRVGIVAKDSKGEYITFTGNQTGCLLMEYILSQKFELGSLPKNSFIVKTIVTTELTRKIAKNYNVEAVEVLTGFKFIGEKIKQLDEFGDKKYIFGFEESYGYLAGTFARDKDGVVTAMLLSEMMAYHKNRGITLYDALQEIYREYGFYKEDMVSYKLEGKSGISKITECMNTLRDNMKKAFENVGIIAIRDYKKQKKYCFKNDSVIDLDLPKSDVLYYELEDGHWFCVRPSGTEPKIKIYYGVCGKTQKESEEILENIKNKTIEIIDKLLFDA